MTIDEIIEQGQIAMNNSIVYSKNVGTYYAGEQIEQWKRLSTRFIESCFGNDIDAQLYRKIATGNCDQESDFNQLFSILLALKAFPPNPQKI